MRAKFNFEYGITNVWRHPPVRGKERIKIGGKAVHMNQKPLALMKLCIRASSDPTDVVWEPFGGLCSGVCAAQELGRIGYAAEILPTVYQRAVNRFVALESSRSQRDLDLHQP